MYRRPKALESLYYLLYICHDVLKINYLILSCPILSLTANRCSYMGVFQPFYKGEQLLRLRIYFSGLMKRPVCFFSIMEFALGGWALPSGRQIFSFRSISPLKVEARQKNGRIVSLKVYLVTLSLQSWNVSHVLQCSIHVV